MLLSSTLKTVSGSKSSIFLKGASKEDENCLVL